jgi:hypothetical protein
MSVVNQAISRTLEQKRKEREEREKKLVAGVSEIDDLASTYNTIVQNLISNYCLELDSFSVSMDKLVKAIRSGDITRYDDLQLEMRLIALSHAMYKATEGLGIIGGQSDMARMTREQKFAEVYKGIKTGTIPDKRAQAEEFVLDEKQIEAIFQRAYNSLAAKIKGANRVLESMKKVLSSRMIAAEVFRKELDDSIAGDIDIDLEDEQVQGLED